MRDRDDIAMNHLVALVTQAASLLDAKRVEGPRGVLWQIAGSTGYWTTAGLVDEALNRIANEGLKA